MKVAIVSGCAFACAVLADRAPPIGAVFTDTVTPRRFATAPVSGMELPLQTVSATGVLKVTDGVEVGCPAFRSCGQAAGRLQPTR